MKYGEEVKLTKSEKLMHSYKVLNEWLSAREQLHLEKIYNSEHDIYLGDITVEKQTAQRAQSLR